VGDPDKPRLVFFFDEAHLLFDDAPKALVDKVEQVVKLVRSKGVGVYFVTQNPATFPTSCWPARQPRAARAARLYAARAEGGEGGGRHLPAQPGFLDRGGDHRAGRRRGAGLGAGGAKGVPSMVGRTMMRPPSSRLGPITAEERRSILANSTVAGLYDTLVDRESAFEVLAEKARRRLEQEEHDRRIAEAEKTARRDAPRRSTRQTPTEAAITSFTRSVASRLGTALVRGILGSLTRGR
jgi:uncharacterized protein